MGGYILDHPNHLQSIQLEDVFSLEVASRHHSKDIQVKEMLRALSSPYDTSEMKHLLYFVFLKRFLTSFIYDEPS